MTEFDEAEKEAYDDEARVEAMIARDRAEQIARSPYFDDEGRPLLVDAVVLFLDLLGTSVLRSASEALDHLRVTHRAMDRARRSSLSDGSKESEGAIYSFSDNVSLGYPMDGHLGSDGALWFMFTNVAWLQLAFANLGFFSRGAIARGGFFADPGLEFIHGPALNRAVLLEKTRAQYPRVVLDEASLAAIVSLSVDQGETLDWDQLLIRDGEIVFVNYLHGLIDPNGPEDEPGAFMRHHKDHIEANLRQFDGVVGIEEKFRWLAGYHNFFVQEFGSADFGEILELVDCSRPLGDFSRFASASA